MTKINRLEAENKVLKELLNNLNNLLQTCDTAEERKDIYPKTVGRIQFQVDHAEENLANIN